MQNHTIKVMKSNVLSESRKLCAKCSTPDSVLVSVKYPKAMHEARLRALEGRRISSKRHSRSVTEARELLEGGKEDNIY